MVLLEKPKLSLLVVKRSPILERVHDVIRHIVKEEIYMHINNKGSDKAKRSSKPKSLNFADTCYAISIRHLQTAFYLLMLGYVLAVVCFVTEIMWYLYRSKGRRRTSTSVTERNK